MNWRRQEIAPTAPRGRVLVPLSGIIQIKARKSVRSFIVPTMPCTTTTLFVGLAHAPIHVKTAKSMGR